MPKRKRKRNKQRNNTRQNNHKTATSLSTSNVNKSNKSNKSNTLKHFNESKSNNAKQVKSTKSISNDKNNENETNNDGFIFGKNGNDKENITRKLGESPISSTMTPQSLQSPQSLSLEYKENDSMMIGTDDQSSDNNLNKMESVLSDTPCLLQTENNNDTNKNQIGNDVMDKFNDIQDVNHEIFNKNDNKNEAEITVPYKPAITHFTAINRNLSKEIDEFIANCNTKQAEILQLKSSIDEQRKMVNDVKTLCDEWRLQIS